MAMVFVSISVILGQAGRIHDETAGAMVLHEAVEKGRHEKTEEPKTVGKVCQEYLGLLLSFPPSIFPWMRKEEHTRDGEPGAAGRKPSRWRRSGRNGF